MIQRICLKNILLYMVSMVEPVFEKIFFVSLSFIFILLYLLHSLVSLLILFFIVVHFFSSLLFLINLFPFFLSNLLFFFSIFSYPLFLLPSFSNIFFFLSFFLVCLLAALPFVLFPIFLSFSFPSPISSFFFFPGCP